mmetsp:Transcript_808/g.1891  ORF Transcript_808/g.1891 Transcript_808/m.1891 type:complete len:206 (-) Transcript_808:395-1012(-)
MDIDLYAKAMDILRVTDEILFHGQICQQRIIAHVVQEKLSTRAPKGSKFTKRELSKMQFFHCFRKPRYCIWRDIDFSKQKLCFLFWRVAVEHVFMGSKRHHECPPKYTIYFRIIGNRHACSDVFRPYIQVDLFPSHDLKRFFPQQFKKFSSDSSRKFILYGHQMIFDELRMLFAIRIVLVRLPPQYLFMKHLSLLKLRVFAFDVL